MALQQAYSTVIQPLRKGSRAPQHVGNILTSGKGIGPYSRLQNTVILPHRKGSRSPQIAGIIHTSGKGIGPYNKFIL